MTQGDVSGVIRGKMPPYQRLDVGGEGDRVVDLAYRVHHSHLDRPEPRMRANVDRGEANPTWTRVTELAPALASGLPNSLATACERGDRRSRRHSGAPEAPSMVSAHGIPVETRHVVVASVTSRRGCDARAALVKGRLARLADPRCRPTRWSSRRAASQRPPDCGNLVGAAPGAA
jgi:hypothetical protein